MRTNEQQLIGMIAYIRDEIHRAQDVSELEDIMVLMDTALRQYCVVSPVQGFKYIRVEYTPQLNRKGVNVATHVPESLVSIFYDLSIKMNQLQAEDPETYVNAVNALNWIARNDKHIG